MSVDDKDKKNQKQSEEASHEKGEQTNSDPRPRPDGTYKMGTFTEGAVKRGEMRYIIPV